MPPRLDPDERRERRRASYRKWYADPGNRAKRLEYWARYAEARTPEQVRQLRERQRRYYRTHKEQYRQHRRVWSKKNRVAIKVRRILRVPIGEARRMLEARP